MNYSILVVDDEECIRELCEDVLPMWGYSVDTAENGFEGIEKAKSGNYQIIMTDIRMPDCDGLMLLDKVPYWAFIVFVFNPSPVKVFVATPFALVKIVSFTLPDKVIGVFSTLLFV